MQRAHVRGQSTIEFALLIVVVIAALVAMQIYLRNALQGKLRQSSDQIGSQWDADQGEYTITSSASSKRKQTVTTAGVSTDTTTADDTQTRDVKETVGKDTSLF